jgi:hypothetical protein
MPTFNNMNELEKYLNEVIGVALETNVAEKTKETMQFHIQTDVYKPYTPREYERTGKLLQDVDVTLIDNNTLIIEDTRNDEPDVENGRDVINVIETGKGYSRISIDDEIGERPFVQNTYDELANGLARESLKEGLKRQGLNVE